MFGVLAWLSLFPHLYAKGTAGPKAWLGVSFIDRPVQSLSIYKHSQPLGAVEVVEVFPKSSAFYAGLKTGDVILGINGKKINGRKTLIDSLENKKSGHKISLEIGRNSKIQTLKVSLSPPPADLQKLTNTLIGSKAPELKGKPISTPISLEMYRGKAILLDFWASWCGPCRYSHPILQKVSQVYQDQGLVVIGISAESKKTIQAYVQKNNLTFPQWHDPASFTHDLYSAYALPTLVFIGKKGTVQRIHTGVLDEVQLSQYIQEILP